MPKSMWVSLTTSYYIKIIIFICILPGKSSKAIPPKISKTLENSSLPRGNRYQLFCTAREGDLPMSFKWMKNGQTLSSSQEIVVRRLDDYSSSLVIESVTEYHSANYSCVVSNAAGKDSFVVQLQVNVPPFWVQQPVDSTVTLGEDLRLRCNAGGHPLPKVTWKKSNGILSPTFHEILNNDRYRINEDGTLTIHRSTIDDETYYSCEVNNGVGEVKKTVKIDVLVPPQVPEKFISVTKKKGQQVDLQCNITGDKPLKVEWRRSDTVVLLSHLSRISVTQKEESTGLTSVFSLREARADDSDLYICVAENAQGKNDMRFRLIIIETPGKVEKLKALQAWSRSIRISWQIPYSGNSPVTKVFVQFIEAEKDNVKEPKYKTVKPTEYSTLVENLKPWTSYKIWVTAENVVGKSPDSAAVTVTTREEEPSNAPNELKVEVVCATEARLSWKPLRKREWNGQLLGYYLSYKNTGTSQPYAGRSVPLSTNKTLQVFVLTGLQRSTGYSARVQAFNGAGVGPNSDAISFRTKSGAPPSTPKLRLSSVQPPSAFFEILPGVLEDEVSEFLLHIRRHSKQWEEIALSLTPTNVYTLGGLSRDSQYQVFVTARNLFGNSEPSKEITFITPKTGFFHYDESEPLYAKMTVVIPVAASILLVVVACITACCLSKNSPPKPPPGMTVNDFAYTGPTSSRSESSFYPQVRTSLSRAPPSTRSVYTESRVYSSVEDYEEPKYECVVEEMKTFIGATKMNPKSVPT